MSALKKWIERRRPEPKTALYGPIGVYLTQQNLNVVQLRRQKGGGIGFQSFRSMPYPGDRSELLASPAAISKLVRRAMRGGNFRGRQVVSAMPPEQVKVMSLSYPAVVAGSEAATIANLMVDRVEGAIQDYVVDYVPIRTSSRDGERLALIAVSSLAHVNQYLDSLASSGLNVDFLEIGPLAIKRLIEFGAGIDHQDNIIVVNVGDRNSHVTTISGRRLLAEQEVQFCEATIVEALSKSLELAPELARDLLLANGLDGTENGAQDSGSAGNSATTATIVEILKPTFLKLVGEIERAFQFAESESRGSGERKLFIVGGISRCAGFAGLLSSLAKIEVERLGRKHLPSPPLTGGSEAISDQHAADMSTAVGLALRGMSLDE